MLVNMGPVLSHDFVEFAEVCIRMIILSDP